MKDDTISRAAALSALRTCYDTNLIVLDNGDELIHYGDAVGAIKALPSAQPKFDEWCDDCKEYDKERHSCPRWNRVIRETVDDMKATLPGWISCSERMPGKNESFYVLCCDKHGEIMIGNVFECDDSETQYSAESEYEYMYDCVAWMPLPKPWGGDTDAH